MEITLKPFKRLKRQIQKFVSHPLSERKDNVLYLNFNKKYKNFDWSKEYYTSSEVTEIVDDKLFRSLRYILNCTDHLDTFKKDRRYYISRDSLEEEFLRREMCSYMDDKMWKRNVCSKKKKKFKTGATKEYTLRGTGGRPLYMGKLPKKYDKKIKKIKEFLLSKKYIFDKKSDFFLKHKQIRYLIQRKLLFGSVSKFDEYLSQMYVKK